MLNLLRDKKKRNSIFHLLRDKMNKWAYVAVRKNKETADAMKIMW